MRLSPTCICLVELHVERLSALVQQQRRRPVDERARERNALLLAAGELLRPSPLETLERHDAEDLADAVPVLAARHAHDLQPANATLSWTDMCGNSAYCWNTMFNGRLLGPIAVTSRP